MDRKIFELPFTKLGVTRYTCPTCGKGVLKVKKDTFHFKETKSSSGMHLHPAWEPDWTQYVYSCLLECTNAVCKDVISSSGVGSVNEFCYDDEEMTTVQGHEEYFNPKYFTPHLKLFGIPIGTQEDVIHEINNSFSLFFSDPSSSSNHIRIALEHLLTHLKIKIFVSPKGRRRHLSLHNRIKLLPAKFNHVKEEFIAIKWLGNAGSHSQHEVKTDDVLDAYELMEVVLVEIFNNKREPAKSLAKKINKKKGPK